MRVSRISIYALVTVFATSLYAPEKVSAASLTAVDSYQVYDPFNCNEFCGGPINQTITTVSLNNDEAGSENENKVTQSFYGIPETEIFMTYRATNSGGTTEYRFTDTVINNADASLGLPGHRIILQTALDYPLSGLDFDSPDFDPLPSITLNVWPAAKVGLYTADTIEWNFYTYKHNSATLGYSLDLPDCGPVSGIACNAGPDSYTFTVYRQFTAPVPAAAYLFLSGMMGLAWLVPKRRKSPS
jgi:hypothetical protein